MSERRGLEADRLNPYLISLFVLLSSATIFEGFDSAMLSFAAPDVRKSLGISLENWGFISGLTRMGVLASFLYWLCFCGCGPPCSSPLANSKAKVENGDGGDVESDTTRRWGDLRAHFLTTRVVSRALAGFSPNDDPRDDPRVLDKEQ